MTYRDPAKVMAKILDDYKVAWGIDDVLVGDNRVPTEGRSGLIVNASPSGVGSGRSAQAYLSNILIYCPDTKTANYQVVKDGIDKAFVVAGKIDMLFRSTEGWLTADGLYLVNPACTSPFQMQDPLTELDVVSMSVDFDLVQGV
jgi:hypothetical protein